MQLAWDVRVMVGVYQVWLLLWPVEGPLQQVLSRHAPVVAGKVKTFGVWWCEQISERKMRRHSTTTLGLLPIMFMV